MFCTKCGKQLLEGSSFCIYCGTKFDAQPVSSPEDFMTPQTYIEGPDSGVHGVTVRIDEIPAAGPTGFVDVSRGATGFPPTDTTAFVEMGSTYAQSQSGQQPGSQLGQPPFAPPSPVQLPSDPKAFPKDDKQKNKKNASEKPKNNKKFIIIGLAAVVVIAGVLIAGFVLGWFGGGSKAVYAMTERTFYENDGSVAQHQTYQLDGQGNVTTAIREYDPVTEKSKTTFKSTQTTTYTNDQYGHPTRTTVKTESKDKSKSTAAPVTTDYTLSLDSENRVVTSKASDKSTAYEYHSNGALKSRVYTTTAGDKTTREFDENGYQTSYESTPAKGKAEKRTYKWELDSNKHATKVTVEKTVDGKTTTTTYTVETDADGNITKLKYANGKTYCECKYKKLDNPSVEAKCSGAILIMN